MFKMPTEKIYILPTGYGVLFLLSSVAMLLTAATYNNNLVYLLAFLLFSVFFVSMVHTHANLTGVHLARAEGQDALAGQKRSMRLTLVNRSKVNRQALDLQALEGRHRSEPGSLTLLKRGESEPLELSLQERTRGVYPLPRLRISTTFPLGLFRAWMDWQPQGSVYVYPRPEGSQELKSNAPSRAESDKWERGLWNQGVDFSEHRKYQPGESYHHIDWKAYARQRSLLTKKFEGEGQELYSLRWEELRGLEEERRLSQLAQWVKVAHERQALYELVMPEGSSGWGQGRDQYRKCQRSLAEFGVKS